MPEFRGNHFFFQIMCIIYFKCLCVWVFTHQVCKSYFPSSFPGKGIGKALMSSVAKVSSLLVKSTILIQSLNCHFNGDSRRPIYAVSVFVWGYICWDNNNELSSLTSGKSLKRWIPFHWFHRFHWNRLQLKFIWSVCTTTRDIQFCRNISNQYSNSETTIYILYTGMQRAGYCQLLVLRRGP